MKSLKGTIYVLISAICFSLGGILIKSIPWNSFSINSIRCIFSFGMIFAFQKYSGRKFVFNKTVLFGAILNFIMGLTFVMATKMTTAANAIVLQFTEPIFIILFLWFFYKQRPKKDAVLTCFLVFCGILCFFYESLQGGGMVGNVLAVISGMTYAGVFLIKKMPGGDFESSILVSHVISILVGLPSFTKETELGVNVWILVIVLGIVQYGFSYIFLSKGLDCVSPVTASLTSTIEPILNPIIVAVFYGEMIGVISIIGAVLVIGSATVYNLKQAMMVEAEN
ncbi:Protein of unknown function DUF6, transmembrane [Lachnospiraceae bacterium TWA4]|nr:Protein of unknown function DUF6, transmembrane [Lachnospiraceae bacterium TWA4]